MGVMCLHIKQLEVNQMTTRHSNKEAILVEAFISIKNEKSALQKLIRELDKETKTLIPDLKKYIAKNGNAVSADNVVTSKEVNRDGYTVAPTTYTKYETHKRV
jgi:hypothetical protein